MVKVQMEGASLEGVGVGWEVEDKVARVISPCVQLKIQLIHFLGREEKNNKLQEYILTFCTKCQRCGKVQLVII